MARRQRIDGRLERAFPGQVRLLGRAATEDEADGSAAGDQPDNVRLQLSFSSETPYLRASYWDEPWIEVLGHNDGECDLSRLADGAPMLANHGRFGTGDTPLLAIGIVERAWIEGGRGMAEVKLSRREGMESLLADLTDGIVRNVSVGYQVQERTLIKSHGGKAPDEYRVTRWLPMEISLVDVPADASVGIGRSADNNPRYRVVDLPEPGATEKGNSMDEQEVQTRAGETTAAASANTVVELDTVRREAAAAERARITEIRSMVRAARLDEAFVESLIGRGISADQAGREILNELARRDQALPTRSAADIVVTRTETDTRRELMGEAILHRANPRHALSDGARQYRGMDLIDMAREALEAAGGRVRGFSRREIAVAALGLDRDIAVRAGAMGSSDFPNILASTINRSLRMAYEVAPRTFTGWARQATAPDFRQVARTQLSEMAALKGVGEGGEYKQLAFGESAEKYSLAKYGGIVALTWETLVNDDLSAFDRIPRAAAEEAAATESDIVYGILSANAAMSDTVALFHANHGNLPTAAAISDTSLGVARAAMRKQTGQQGRILNILPQYLVVGPDKEVEANKYTSAQFVAAKASDVNPNFNTSLEVVVDGRISGNKWYLMASPGRIDTVEYAYLEGEQGLYTEQRVGFEVDGLQVKVRLVFAAKAIDWRGMVYNSGA